MRLGTLKRLDPRAAWKHEARDFTPWLRENFQLVAETVGLEVDLVESEVSVGDFAVDLVGRELNTGRTVIVENQLEPTDHTHLGQLLTYAAGQGAVVVIWISRGLREEHRQALDWLNSITTDEVAFFGIEIELLQIDESDPAPHLKLVVQPNEWQRETKARSQISDRARAYHEFYTELLEKLKAARPGITSASRVGYDNWLGFSSGKSGFSYSIVFAAGSRFRVELYIDTGDGDRNKEIFDEFQGQRTEIAAALDCEVSWERLDDRRASRVAVYRPGSILDAPEQRQGLQDWAVETALRFADVFRPLIGAL